MLIPKKIATLKHDLYKVVLPDSRLGSSAYTEENAEKAIEEFKDNITLKKHASAGLKFVYCDTDRLDGAHGWYARVHNTLRKGNGGFANMTQKWGEENLTEPEEYTKQEPDQDPNDPVQMGPQ